MEITTQGEMVRIGVLADTHIPDRVNALHPQIIPLLTHLQVDFIIHAGDISTSNVITELERVAPVHAVRGNRDWWKLRNLPIEKQFKVNNIKIIVTHGQGNLFSYFWEKVPIIFLGYRFDRFYRKFSKIKYDFDIMIFGHSHRAENRWVGEKLFFNPGSASDPGFNNEGPSLGLIKIWKEGRIDTQILQLKNMRTRRGKWVE